MAFPSIFTKSQSGERLSADQMGSTAVDFITTNGSLPLSFRKRSQGIVKAREAYEGGSPESLKVGANGENDNVRLNWARDIVDQNIAATLGNGEIVITVDNERLQSHLDEEWKRDRLNWYLHKGEIRASYGGHIFMRVMRDPLRPRKAKIVIWDPETVDVEFDQEDPEEPTAYIRHWLITKRDEKGKERVYKRRQTHRREVLGNPTAGPVKIQWRITDEEATEKGDYYELASEVWPHEQSQVVDCPNMISAEFWGMSDLEPDHLKLIDSIERKAADQSRMSRLYANRPVVTKGLDEKQIREFDDMSVGANKHLEDGQEASVLEDRLDGIQHLTALVQQWVRYLKQLTLVPDTNDDKMADASAAQLAWRHKAWFAKKNAQRMLRGQMLHSVFVLIAIIELGIVAPFNTTVAWPELVDVDPKEIAETVKAENEALDNRVKIEKRAERLGYDPDEDLEDEAPVTPGGPLGAILDKVGAATEEEGEEEPDREAA